MYKSFAKFYPLFLFLLSGFVLTPLARLDFDQHHDGYMAAGAIVSRDNGVIFKDVFAQYGSVTPWIQGLWLKIFDQPVLGLRILNVFFICLTIYLLANLGTKMPKDWPIKPWMGWLAAPVWFVLNDVFTSVPMHPWSSLLATFLSVYGIYALGKAIYFFELQKTYFSMVYAALSGISLSITIFTRLTVGVLNLAIGLTFFLLIVKSNRQQKKVAQAWILASLMSLALVFGTYLVNGSLRQWQIQTLEWPQQTYSNQISSIISMNIYLLSYYKFAIGLLLVIATIEFLCSIKLLNISEKILVSFRLLSGIYLAWFIFYSDAKVQISPDTFNSTQMGLRLNLFLELLTYTCMVFTVYFFSISIIELKMKTINSNNFLFRISLVGFTLAALSQIVHSPDSRHLWWSLPLGLIILFLSFQSYEYKSKFSLNPLLFSVVFALAYLPSVTRDFINLPRTEIPPGFVSSGMRVEQGIWHLHVSNYEFLKSNLSPNESVVFLVKNGDLSVFDGKYHADNASFVWWGPSEPSLEIRLQSVNKAIVDADNQEMINRVKKSGFTEIGTNSFITLFIKNN